MIINCDNTVVLILCKLVKVVNVAYFQNAVDTFLLLDYFSKKHLIPNLL